MVTRARNVLLKLDLFSIYLFLKRVKSSPADHACFLASSLLLLNADYTITQPARLCIISHADQPAKLEISRWVCRAFELSLNPLLIFSHPALGQASLALVAGCLWGASVGCPLHVGGVH